MALKRHSIEKRGKGISSYFPSTHSYLQYGPFHPAVFVFPMLEWKRMICTHTKDHFVRSFLATYFILLIMFTSGPSLRNYSNHRLPGNEDLRHHLYYSGHLELRAVQNCSLSIFFHVWKKWFEVGSCSNLTGHVLGVLVCAPNEMCR